MQQPNMQQHQQPNMQQHRPVTVQPMPTPIVLSSGENAPLIPKAGDQNGNADDPTANRGAKKIIFWVVFGLLCVCTAFQLMMGIAYATQRAGSNSGWARFVTGNAWAVDNTEDCKWGKAARDVHDSHKRWQCFWVFLRATLTGFLALASFFAARCPRFDTANKIASWLWFAAIGGGLVGFICYALPYWAWEVSQPFMSQKDQNTARVGVMLPLFVSAITCFTLMGVAIAALMEYCGNRRADRDAEFEAQVGVMGVQPMVMQPAQIFVNSGGAQPQYQQQQMYGQLGAQQMV